MEGLICPLKSQLTALGYGKCTWKTKINAEDTTFESLEKDPQDVDYPSRAFGRGPGEPGNPLDHQDRRYVPSIGLV